MRNWLALLTAIGLTACGSESKNDPPPPPTPIKAPDNPRPTEPVKIEIKEPTRFNFENRDLVYGQSISLGRSYLARNYGFDCYVGDEETELGPRLPFYRFEAKFNSNRRVLHVKIYALQIHKVVALKAIRLRDTYARLEHLRESQRRERCGRSVVEQVHYGDSAIWTADYLIPNNRRGLERTITFGDSNADLEDLRKEVDSLSTKYRRTRVAIETNRDDVTIERDAKDLIKALSDFLKAAAEKPLNESDLQPIKLVQVGIAPSYP